MEIRLIKMIVLHGTDWAGDTYTYCGLFPKQGVLTIKCYNCGEKKMRV